LASERKFPRASKRHLAGIEPIVIQIQNFDIAIIERTDLAGALLLPGDWTFFGGGSWLPVSGDSIGKR
jgi:hypothetical protein